LCNTARMRFHFVRHNGTIVYLDSTSNYTINTVVKLFPLKLFERASVAGRALQE
jgi:hypothetical protein